MKEGRIRLLFQPVVSLRGDSSENYAVMARLLDQNDREIPPGRFPEGAEQRGQMAGIDRRIIKRAIRELGRQRKEGRKINFFIGICGDSITDPATLLTICDSMRDAQVKGAWLTFRIRDTDLRIHPREAKRLMAGLKKIKCRIALTHFGLAPRPGAVLEHLPFDFIELDPSFTRELAAVQEKQEALGAISRMIRERGLRTIATAVEDANSLAVLWTAGVDYVQGHFLQGPTGSISCDSAGG